jgi:ABC-type polysaccharide/polyol phosphate export systems, permease component
MSVRYSVDRDRRLRCRGPAHGMLWVGPVFWLSFEAGPLAQRATLACASHIGMQNFPCSPLALVASGWRNRNLILSLTKREIVGRYRGSVFGLAWSFFNPLLMLAIYTFVFSVVFKARWGISQDEGRGEFAILLFSGMIVHGLFAECVNRAPGLVLGNVNYVKKIVFPLEILAWVALGSSLFHMSVSWVVLLGAQWLLGHIIPATVVLYPVVLFPLILGTMGLTWFLAGLGVYLRDVGQVTGMFTTVMLFISAVFFPLSALPPAYRQWLQYNPLAVVIEQSREVLILGRIPAWDTWLLLTAVGAVMAWLGFAWFQKTRKGFADVL